MASGVIFHSNHWTEVGGTDDSAKTMSVLSAAAIDDETTVAVAMATPIETNPFGEKLQTLTDDDAASESAPFVPHGAEAESVVKATEKEKTRESTTFVVKRMALAMTLPALAEDETDFAVPVAMETTMATEEVAVVKETEKKTKKKKRVVVEAGGQSDFDLITNLLGGASDLVDVDDRADAYVASLSLGRSRFSFSFDSFFFFFFFFFSVFFFFSLFALFFPF
jgi:hypothetical protein